ncbi:hypothetical protein NDU88_011082 [Pleurodeles waltl]|uniref:Uncharacterized protein n=1 Tax=Pleurodeles waltl TaxID=8319 RepID=A0AAV7QZ27_PLEWA|nr:hypothetical protein NDU88_011082 [Pleurodeles waltl]
MWVAQCVKQRPITSQLPLQAAAMAGAGRLRSGTGAKNMQEAATQDSHKLDAILETVERIGDSLERARTSLEGKIDKVASDLAFLHADHRKLAEETGTLETRIDVLAPTTSRLEAYSEACSGDWYWRGP